MIKQITLKELYLQSQDISMEQVGVFHGASNAFKKLSNMITDTTSFVSSKLTSAASFVKTFFVKGEDNRIDFSYYKQFASKYRYTDLNSLHIQVPDGFEGNMLDFTEKLILIHNDFTMEFLDEIINPFNIYISQLINTPSLIESQTFTHKVEDSDVEKFKKDIGKFIKAKKHNTKPFKECYGNMSSLEKQQELLDKLMVNQHNMNVTVIKPYVDEINDKLMRLIETIQDKNNNINPSAKTMKLLSELTYTLASHIEFFAVLDSITISFLHCCSENNKTFKRFSGGLSMESTWAFSKYNRHLNALKPVLEQ